MSDVQKLIKAVNKADSADLLLQTVEDLAKISDRDAIPTLVEVLGFNNPGAAVAAVDGLIAIGEPVVPYLLNNLDSYNYGARAWATRVFAGVGDPAALNLLLEAAVSDFSQSVRRAAAKGLGSIIWSKLPAEEVDSARQQVLNALLQATKDGEWVVRYAAVVGLEGLLNAPQSTQSTMVAKIKVRFEELFRTEPEQIVRARVQYAFQQSNR